MPSRRTNSLRVLWAVPPAALVVVVLSGVRFGRVGAIVSSVGVATLVILGLIAVVLRERRPLVAPRAADDDRTASGPPAPGPSSGPLTVTNLRGARLRDANLRGVDLRGVDLRGADLERADLSGASLEGALLALHLDDDRRG